MPHIDSTKFGEIVVDGKAYHQVMITGGRVEERDYEKLTALFGTSHRIGDWEAEALFSDGPEVIVIGTGTSGMLTVPEEIKERAKKEGIHLDIALTPEAVEIYNRRVEEGKRVNALIHTTC